MVITPFLGSCAALCKERRDFWGHSSCPHAAHLEKKKALGFRTKAEGKTRLGEKGKWGKESGSLGVENRGVRSGQISTNTPFRRLFPFLFFLLHVFYFLSFGQAFRST